MNESISGISKAVFSLCVFLHGKFARYWAYPILGCRVLDDEKVPKVVEVDVMLREDFPLL